METVFITYDQALSLVERIASRTAHFGHCMSIPEQESMAMLLSEIGVNTEDLIDVDRLADEYAINAQLVTPKEVDQYSRGTLDDALFTWTENGEKYYCIQW